MLGLSLLLTTAQGATLHVFPDGSGLYTTIQNAIDAAQPLDTVLLAPGTYLGEGNRGLDFGGKDLVLKGNGAREEIVIDCEYQDGGLYFHSGETSNSLVADLSILHGLNQAASRGAGVNCEYSSPRFERIVLSENEALADAGMRLSHSNAQLAHVLFLNNTGSGTSGGAGIYSSDATFTDVQFIGNQAVGGGAGAVYCFRSMGAIFENCLFQDNVAGDEGGGSFINASSPQFLNCQFISNTAHVGGAVYCSGSAAEFIDCLFFDNYATSSPGAIRFDYVPEEGQALLANSLVIGNQAVYGTGGISARNEVEPHILNTTIVGNSTGELSSSALVSSYFANPIVENCTIAFHEGGGIWAGSHYDIPTVLCSDVFGNEGGNYSGAIADQTGINGNISENPLFCDLSEWVLTLANESPCLPDNNDCGVLMGALGADCTVTGLGELPAEMLRPIRCFPNPFNPQTTIHFELPTATEVSITILDIAGRRVRRLFEGTRNEGVHQITWNGRSDTGEALPSGIYLVKLEAGKLEQSDKLTLIR